MHQRRLCLSLLFLLCCAIDVVAQDKPAWVAQLELALRQKEPKWRIERTIVRSEYSFEESMTLKSGPYRANVHLIICDSVKTAQEAFAGEAIAVSNLRHAQDIKTTLPNLGDENYMWKRRASTPWPTIYFRKGHVIVTVFAPSVAVAKRFAQYAAARIPPANNPSQPTPR